MDSGAVGLSEIDRIRDEQRRAALGVEAGQGFVAALGALDWMAEELALLREAGGR